MNSFPFLFLVCLVKGIENVPLPASPIKAQTYLNNAQSYVNGIPSARGVKVPSLPAGSGNLVINPPRLPTAKTTTTTKAPVATKTTTKSPVTTTTKGPVATTTTTKASVVTPTTTGTPAAVRTTTKVPVATTTTELPTTCAPSEFTTSMSSTALSTSSETPTTTEIPTTSSPIEATTSTSSTALPTTETTEIPTTCATSESTSTTAMPTASETLTTTEIPTTSSPIEATTSTSSTALPTTETTEIPTTCATSESTSTTAMPTASETLTTTEIPTTSSPIEATTSTSSTALPTTETTEIPTTCATSESTSTTAMPTASETPTTTEIPTTSSPIEATTSTSSTALPTTCETTTTTSTPNTTRAALNETNILSERLKQIITQLLTMRNELFKVTTSDLTRQLINQLIYKIRGNNDVESTATEGNSIITPNEDGATDVKGEYKVTVEYGNSNSKDEVSDITTNGASHDDEQFHKLIIELRDKLSEPITSAKIEELNQLILQLINQITSKDTTTVEEDHAEEKGDSTASGSTGVADESTDTKNQFNLLITQLTILINQPITNTTYEQINKLIAQLISKLISEDAVASTRFKNVTSNTSTGVNTNSGANITIVENGHESNGNVVETTEGVITISDQMKEIVRQILNLMDQQISTVVTEEEINELISQLIEILTDETGGIGTNRDSASTGGGTSSSDGDSTSKSGHTSSSVGETIGAGGATTSGEASSSDGETIVGTRPDDLMTQQISQIEKLLTKPISSTTSERMKQLIAKSLSQLIGRNYNNTTNGNATTGGATSTASGTSTRTNTDKLMFRNNEFYEALMKRRALRRARRKELAFLRSEKRKADALERRAQIESRATFSRQVIRNQFFLSARDSQVKSLEV